MISEIIIMIIIIIIIIISHTTKLGHGSEKRIQQISTVGV